MSAEILCIGTELLLGNITNGNAQWLAEELAGLGIPHTTARRWWATTVGGS